jgi:MFS family permease
MRPLRLARVAAEAEGILLRRHVRRIVIRVMLAAVALLFLMGALAMLHVAFWLQVSPSWGPVVTALALAGIDAVIAAIIALLAARDTQDKVMTDAVAVRNLALNEMRSAVTITAMLRPVLGILLEQWLEWRRRAKEQAKS